MNSHVSKHKLFPHKNTAERWAQEMLSQWQQGRVGLVLDAKRVYYAHKHTVYAQVHTSAPWVIKEVISIQNTTGIALIPCSPCSINNCSVLFNLRKQAGAMKRGRLLKGWRLHHWNDCSIPAFFKFLHKHTIIATHVQVFGCVCTWEHCVLWAKRNRPLSQF